MKVHISFEKPTSFVLKLDDVQAEAWKRYQEAIDASEEFSVFDRTGAAELAFNENVRTWDDFIDSISYELLNARIAPVFDVIDVSDMPWSAVNP